MSEEVQMETESGTFQKKSFSISFPQIMSNSSAELDTIRYQSLTDGGKALVFKIVPNKNEQTPTLIDT